MHAHHETCRQGGLSITPLSTRSRWSWWPRLSTKNRDGMRMRYRRKARPGEPQETPSSLRWSQVRTDIHPPNSTGRPCWAGSEANKIHAQMEWRSPYFVKEFHQRKVRASYEGTWGMYFSNLRFTTETRGTHVHS